jgi:hypothetical protein
LKPGFLAPRGALDNKPPHGAPCNRCGLCCKATICPLGRYVFKLPEFAGMQCPALEQTEDGYRCGIIADPASFTSKSRVMRFGIEALRRAALLLIGAGDGCDARFNGEPRDEAFAAALDRKYANLAHQLRKAKRMWGGRSD